VIAALAALTIPPATSRPPRAKLCGKNSRHSRAPKGYWRFFAGEERRDERALGRIFGEELPSGLVLVES
jgi:hypothetical protein